MNMVISHWSANPLVPAACGIVAVTYLLGRLAGQGRLTGPRPAGSVGHTAAFCCGLLAVVVALVSPVGYWAGDYIWIRSLQDALLAFAAPSLIVLSAPWLLLRRGAAVWLPLPRIAAERIDAPGPNQQDRHPGPGPSGWSWMSWPVLATVAFNVCWLAWHLPSGYDAALRHPPVLAAEAVSYLGLGIAFWLQVLGSAPFSPRFAPLPRLALVTATFVCVSVLSMVLIFGSGVVYPAYRGPAHRVLSVVSDQQVGGAVLWTLAILPFGITAIALCIRWLAADESGMLDAGFDCLLRRPKPGWPSRPGFR
ncbi:MAG TPA: cytochrome c oxidase assembly protein [Streptosporangiaceae bacterium]|jgi:cytochrome c oxidase assembly factor CtaG